MSGKTGIAWTDHTFNPWWGCQRVSPGCENCYAETWDARFGGKHWGPKAERRFFGARHWNEPLRWNAAAEKAGRRARVFCASMADVFEDRPDLVPARLDLWALIGQTPHLDWQILTKRPENAAALLPWVSTPWPNVWIGTSVEDQRRANERIPHLLQVPAVVRFLSVEPLLERVSFRWAQWAPLTDARHLDGLRGIGWAIIGGESGHGARAMDPEWAREVLDQCHEAGVPVFMKQLGGVFDKQDDPSRWPVDLRVRDFPAPWMASETSARNAPPKNLSESRPLDPPETA